MKLDDAFELKRSVEKAFGKPVQKQEEVAQLKEDIFSTTNKTIGFNTLRRFFDFLPKTAPSIKTLNTLSNYAGYTNYTTFSKKTHINDAWFQWLHLHEIETKDTLNEEDIRFLLHLKTHNKEYDLYLISLLKSYVMRRNFTALYDLFSINELFTLPINKLLKIANITGLLLRNIPLEDLPAAIKLAETKLFRETVIYFMIDYSNLYGHYGAFLQAAIQHEVKEEHQLFLKLITSYALFLKGKKIKSILYNAIPTTFFPALQGRYFAHQILTSSTSKQEEIIKFCLSTGIHKNDIVMFFLEIIPALIIKKRIDLIALILETNYEDLFNLYDWNLKNCENIYLISETLVAIEEGNYLKAKNHLAFVDEEKSIYDYKEYFHVFYLIANYHIVKNTSKTTTETQSIALEFTALIKKLGFHYFNVAFLKTYFDNTPTTGATAT